MAYATLKRGSSQHGCFAIAKEDPPFFISNSQLARWNLAVGQELDEKQYRALKAAKEQDDCNEKALALLSMREHTSLELRQKLGQKYPKEMVEKTISSLIADGSLSEQRYAEVFLRSRLKRNPEGKPVLLQRLLAKGVSRDVAKEALDEAWEESGEATLKEAYRQAARSTDDKTKLMMKLQRKGFSYREIKEVMSDNN